MTAITDAAQTLAGLLRAAEEGGLPMPYDADITAGGLGLMVHTLADLADWSTWLDSPIDDSTRSEGAVHHRVYGLAGPFPVRVTTLVHAEAGVR